MYRQWAAELKAIQVSLRCFQNPYENAEKKSLKPRAKQIFSFFNFPARLIRRLRYGILCFPRHVNLAVHEDFLSFNWFREGRIFLWSAGSFVSFLRKVESPNRKEEEEISYLRSVNWILHWKKRCSIHSGWRYTSVYIRRNSFDRDFFVGRMLRTASFVFLQCAENFPYCIPLWSLPIYGSPTKPDSETLSASLFPRVHLDTFVFVPLGSTYGQ